MTNVLLDVDLRMGHTGLRRYAKDQGIDTTLMKDGEVVLFINVGRNKVKAYSYNGVLSYLRIDDPRSKLSLNALDLIPQVSDRHEKMAYSRAAREVLSSIIERVGKGASFELAA